MKEKFASMLFFSSQGKQEKEKEYSELRQSRLLFEKRKKRRKRVFGNGSSYTIERRTREEK